MHLASGHHLVFADDRNVVFGLARDDARIASVARVQIDRHAPLVPAGFFLLVGEYGPERWQLVLVFFQRRDFLARYGAYEIAPFHQMVILHAREWKRVAGERDLRACAESKGI